MKRELVTGLLTLSLLASMLPANAQAAEGMFGASAAGQVQTMTEGAGEDGVQTENTADIDGTQYATLAEAVAQAEEGATIRLLRDVELDASGLVNGQGALTLSKRFDSGRQLAIPSGRRRAHFLSPATMAPAPASSIFRMAPR